MRKGQGWLGWISVPEVAWRSRNGCCVLLLQVIKAHETALAFCLIEFCLFPGNSFSLPSALMLAWVGLGVSVWKVDIQVR